MGFAAAVALSISAPMSATASDSHYEGLIADNTAAIEQGLAMANAMDVIAPDPGSKYRLNIGTGFSEDEAALGITASGRVGASSSTIIYLGIAGTEERAAGKAGVSFQW